eukprot:gnl/Trimastix_PCT/1710.p1 GENE.gnl/Trimastix_PCT/1710~~gnl/Trimastix_PCT/1710.p1  ORF type:complete len:743 (+),score=293.38 gnl/Trimastix_PCT/1710:1516-3744(+)
MYSPAVSVRKFQKLIITVALTGNVPTKSMNPNLPVTPVEIAEDVARCYALGARVFHVHARDENQRPTLDLNKFRAIVREIKARCPDAIVQLSTGARAGKDPEARCNVVRLRPEMGSFTTGSNNLAKGIYENDPAFVLKLAKVFRETDVKPEIECFDFGHITNAIFLRDQGILKSPLHFNFVLGAAGPAAGTGANLAHMVASIPEGSTWTATGTRFTQFPMAMLAMAMNGHVRVGCEDYIFMPDGKTPSSNADIVRLVVQTAQNMGREIATVEEAREMLGLPPAYKDRILPMLDPTADLMLAGVANPAPWSEANMVVTLRKAKLSSPALAINQRGKKLRAADDDYLTPSFGESPFPVPAVLRQALADAAGENSYLPCQGTLELREAIARSTAAQLGTPELTANNVIVSIGTKMIIQMLVQLIDAEFLIPSPCWVSYVPMCEMHGRKYKLMPTTARTHWKITPEQLDEMCLSDASPDLPIKRRAMIFTSPGNPTGTSYTRAELEALAPVMRRHQILVISDEIYSPIMHPGSAHASLGAADLHHDLTIPISGLSKGFGAGGWRMGFAVVPNALGFLVPKINEMISTCYSCVPAPLQKAALAVFRENPDPSIALYIQKTSAIMGALGRVCYEIFNQAGIVCAPPTGGFYIAVDFAPFRDRLAARGVRTGTDLCEGLIQDKHVIMLPGEAFSTPPSSLLLRFCMVDYNGQAALDAATSVEAINEDFVRKHCPRCILAAQRIAEYAQE